MPSIQRIWERAQRRKWFSPDQLLHSEWNRRLGIFGLVSISGVMTLSIVLFVLLPQLFAASSLKAPPLLAVLLGGGIQLLAAQQLASVARSLPKNGLFYQLAFVRHTEGLAFLVGWSQLLDLVILPAVFSHALVDHSNLLFQGALDEWKTTPVDVLSAAAIWIASLFMCCSMRVLSTTCIVFLIAALFTALSTSVVALLHNAVNLRVAESGDPARRRRGGGPAARGCCSASCAPKPLGSRPKETESARKLLPRMLVGWSRSAFLIAAVGVLAFFPFGLRQPFTPDTLLPSVFDLIGIQSARYLLSFGSVVGLIGALMVSFPPAVRLATDDLLPGRRLLGSQSTKGGSPRAAVLLTAFISSLLAAVFSRHTLCRLLPLNITLRLLGQAILVFMNEFAADREPTEVPRYFGFPASREDSLLDRRHARRSLGSEFSTPTDDEEETHAMERLWRVNGGPEEAVERKQVDEAAELLKSDDSSSHSSYGSTTTVDESSLIAAPISLQQHNCLIASCSAPSRQHGSERWPPFHIYEAETPHKSRPSTVASTSREMGDEKAERTANRHLSYFFFLSTMIASSSIILRRTHEFVPILPLITALISVVLLIFTVVRMARIPRQSEDRGRWLPFGCLLSAFLLVQLVAHHSR
ncbi:AA-permease domain-containing protein [Aphelenchoides fujianensis]|nr:AA-permease domain-containing protein [Aphelenchoides fujianensis]